MRRMGDYRPKNLPVDVRNERGDPIDWKKFFWHNSRSEVMAPQQAPARMRRGTVCVTSAPKMRTAGISARLCR